MFFNPTVFAAGSPVKPQAWAQINRGCVNSGVATLQGLECLVQNILAAALPLLGLVFAAMIVLAGFQLITAGGEKEGIQKAKSTATMAVAGLFMAAAAWLILVFLEKFTGFKLTEFKVQ